VNLQNLKIEGDMERLEEVAEHVVKTADKKNDKAPLFCPICGQPATQSVDGEPSCSAHIEQVYEHQVEDYTSRHLADNQWRKV